MKKSAVKIHHVIMCDDVRTEDSGKHILIGVYSDAIVIPKDTAKLVFPLAFYVNITAPRDKTVSVVTWIEGPGRKRMQESDFGQVGIPKGFESDRGQLVWKLFPWKPEGLGTYKLHLTQGGLDVVIYEFELRN